MIEFTLVIVIGLLCALIGWQEYSNRKERSKFINALIARTPEQLRDLDFVDKVQVKIPDTAPNLVPVENLSDTIPVEQMTDEEFDKQIHEVMNNG